MELKNGFRDQKDTQNGILDPLNIKNGFLDPTEIRNKTPSPSSPKLPQKSGSLMSMTSQVCHF
jgi:hypothetical protein